MAANDQVGREPNDKISRKQVDHRYFFKNTNSRGLNGGGLFQFQVATAGGVTECGTEGACPRVEVYIVFGAREEHQAGLGRPGSSQAFFLGKPRPTRLHL